MMKIVKCLIFTFLQVYAAYTFSENLRMSYNHCSILTSNIEDQNAIDILFILLLRLNKWQKQSPRYVPWKRCSYKFAKLKFQEFLRTSFYRTHSSNSLWDEKHSTFWRLILKCAIEHYFRCYIVWFLWLMHYI